MKKKLVMCSLIVVLAVSFSFSASAAKKEKQYVDNKTFIVEANQKLDKVKQRSDLFKVTYDDGSGNYSYEAQPNANPNEVFAVLNRFEAQGIQTATINGYATGTAYKTDDIEAFFTDNLTLENNGLGRNDAAYWTGQSSGRWYGGVSSNIPNPKTVTVSDTFFFGYDGFSASIAIPASFGATITPGNSTSTVTWAPASNNFLKVAGYQGVRAEAYNIYYMGHTSSATFDWGTYSQNVNATASKNF